MTDYLYAQTMTQMAAQVAQIPTASAKDSQGGTAEDFQKLLDKKTGAESPKPESSAVNPSEKAEAVSRPEEAAVPSAEEDVQELEKQMALAAMAVMQNPVVTEEVLPEIQPETIVPLEEVSAEMMSGYLEDPQTPVQADSQPVSVDGDPVQAEDLASDLPPQEIEAPQAETKLPDRDTVQVRVTTRDDAVQENGGEEETPADVPVEKPVFEDVHDIPVKVGEAPAEEPEPEVPVENQLSGRLAQALNAGDTHVEIQLNPENLGQVTVEMTFAENGSLHVTLHAENGKTLNLLEKGLDNLHMMLAKNTQQEVHVEVQKQEESQQQNFYDGRGGHAQHQGQRRQHQEEEHSGDFLQQLRLGLIPQDGQ